MVRLPKLQRTMVMPSGPGRLMTAVWKAAMEVGAAEDRADQVQAMQMGPTGPGAVIEASC